MPLKIYQVLGVGREGKRREGNYKVTQNPLIKQSQPEIQKMVPCTAPSLISET